MLKGLACRGLAFVLRFRWPAGRAGTPVLGNRRASESSGWGHTFAFRGVAPEKRRCDPTPELFETLADVNAGIHSLGNRSVFVTMLFGVFDPVLRTFRFVRAGHTPLLWRKASGEVATLSPRGIGVGMTSPRTFSALCEQSTITTGPGDFLILYSDGVTEAMNERTEEFGDDRLLTTVRDRITDSMSAEEARVILVQAVDDFRGTAPAHDDMTLVIVKC